MLEIRVDTLAVPSFASRVINIDINIAGTLSNDVTLADDSAIDVPSEHAVKTYVDTRIGAFLFDSDGLGFSSVTTQPDGEGDPREEIWFYRPPESWQAVGAPVGHDEYSSIYFGPPYVGGQNSVHPLDGSGHSPTLETYFNTGYGQFALYEITTGSYNVAFGHEALRENTVGAWNTAFGEAAGCNNAEGDGNTWLGFKTGLGLNGITNCSDNVAVGYFAMGHMGVGSGNVAVGYSCMGTAGVTVEADTLSGSFNVAVGMSIAASITSGNRNVMLGHAAAADLTTGAFNIFLGYNAGQGLTTGSNNIAIGFVDDLTAAQANTLTIANPGTGVHYVYGDATSLHIRGLTSSTAFEVMRNVGSVVNYLRVTGAATGNGAILGTFGTDADVSMLFQTRQSSAQATRMTLALGLVIGAPTGGDKGAGTLNAVGVYDDNILLTDLVLDLANKRYDPQRYVGHPIASEMKEWWLDPRAYRRSWEAASHLPALPAWDNDNKPSTGHLLTRHTAELELHAVHLGVILDELDGHENRIAALEDKLAA